MKKLIFGVALLFAIVLSLNVDIQKNGADLSNISLLNIVTTANAQDECCPGIYDADEVWCNGEHICEYDPFDCCIW